MVLGSAVDEVISRQVRRIAVPKRFTLPMRDIVLMQPRFERRSGRRALRFLEHPRFRAAYDFLLLRAEAGEVDVELADWWTDLQAASDEDRIAMVENRPVSEQAAEAPKKSSRRRRRPRRRRTSTGPAADS
jgi:poly(A) polymerase